MKVGRYKPEVGVSVISSKEMRHTDSLVENKIKQESLP